MNARLSLVSIICIASLLSILTGCRKSTSGKHYESRIEDRIVQRIFSNPDSALIYIDESVAADSISADHGVYLKAYYYLYIRDEKDSAVTLLESLTPHFENFTPQDKEEKHLYTSFLILAAKTYWQLEHFPYALHYAERAAEDCRNKTKNTKYIAYDMDCIRGGVLFNMGHRQEGGKIIRDAVASSDTCTDFIGTQSHLHCHMQQLSFLYESDSCEKMISLCDECCNDVRNVVKCTKIPEVYHNEDEMKNFQDFYIGLFEAYRSCAYAQLGQLDSARASLDRCMETKWAESHKKTSISLIRTYSGLGMVDMLDSAYYDFIEKNESDTLQEKLVSLLKGKASILLANHDYQRASFLLDKITDIEKEMYQKRIAEQIQFSEEQYQEKLAEKENREVAELKTRVWITHTIIFALIVLAIILIYYNRKNNKQLRLSYQALLDRQAIIDTNLKIITAETSATEEQSAILYRRIHKLMDSQKPYLKEDFSINTLADLLNTNVNYISHAINYATDRTFPQWLADYRNRIVIKALQKNPNLTISEVCLMTGHNTRETFSRQFKAQNGISFTEFKGQITKSGK